MRRGNEKVRVQEQRESKRLKRTSRERREMMRMAMMMTVRILPSLAAGKAQKRKR